MIQLPTLQPAWRSDASAGDHSETWLMTLWKQRTLLQVVSGIKHSHDQRGSTNLADVDSKLRRVCKQNLTWLARCMTAKSFLFFHVSCVNHGVAVSTCILHAVASFQQTASCCQGDDASSIALQATMVQPCQLSILTVHCHACSMIQAFFSALQMVYSKNSVLDCSTSEQFYGLFVVF